MPNPHERIMRSALEAVAELDELSEELRTGPLSSAYRTIIRALRDNLDDPEAIMEAFEMLRERITSISEDYYERSISVGLAQAERDYDLDVFDGAKAAIVAAIVATRAIIDLQEKRVLAVSKTGIGEEYVFGDDSRVGIVTPSPILNETAFWTTSLATLAYDAAIRKEVSGDFVRQAVALLSHKTTETCLNVHGQVVGLDENFVLTGTPRYADEMFSSPFHNHCRTCVTIIKAEWVDDDVTKRMREEARQPIPGPKYTLEGRVGFKVRGNRVLEFRESRWHKYASYRTGREARKAATSLNEARRP